MRHQPSPLLAKADAVLALTPFYRDGSHQADVASSRLTPRKDGDFLMRGWSSLHAMLAPCIL